MSGSKVIVAIRVKAPPERAFQVFVAEIAAWWRPNMLFAFTPRAPGVMAFEPGSGGRLIETRAGGKVFEVGKIRAWEPPGRLVFGFRQATFTPEEDTEVEARFESVGDGETRVTITHTGWDSIPEAHVARHGFPNQILLTRLGEWWRTLLSNYKDEKVEGE
jgi:uncharacterized protein YndB with AHSA1/START domain